jgi:hypothetical protein
MPGAGEQAACKTGEEAREDTVGLSPSSPADDGVGVCLDAKLMLTNFLKITGQVP